MAFLKINDLELGAPTKYEAIEKDYNKYTRMASGKMVVDVRYKKWLISVIYEHLTDIKRAELFNLFDNQTATGLFVEFYDKAGNVNTGFFRTKGDLSTPQILNFKNGLPNIWLNISFELEEI